MNVKFLDVAAINERFREEMVSEMVRVFDSGALIRGSAVRIFEEAFAAFCGSKFCVGTGNGLDALVGMLEACIEIGYLKRGDEVIVPANTFIATALAVRRAGLALVFCEPDEGTFNMSAETVKSCITEKSRAILAVHLYGLPAQMPELKALADEYGLLLLEDAAQAHGASVGGKKVGNWGLAAAFSFYPGKNLGAAGDAGAVTTNDEKLYEALQAWGNYGSKTKYFHDTDGVNSRLDSIQAAMLSVKLKYLVGDNERRREIAAFYCANIEHPKIILPVTPDNYIPVWHLFVVKCKRRNALQEYLKNMDIETLIHYPLPIYRQGAFREFSGEDYPVCTKIQEQILSLPMSPVLSNEAMAYVVEKINEFPVQD